MTIERQALLPVVESSPVEAAQLELGQMADCPSAPAVAGATGSGPYLVSIDRNCPKDSSGHSTVFSARDFIARHFPH